MNKTTIEWVRNPVGTQGYTWNPITGCLNGCSYCYARKLANGRLKPLYLANTNIAPNNAIPDRAVDGMIRADPFYPRFWEDRLGDLRTWTAEYMMPPRGIFVCDMGELFGDWVPSQWQEAIFEAIRTCPQHRFYLLTKQPQNLIKFSPFPDNCWVGVTATNQKALYKAVKYLSQIEASIKYLSLEPHLEHMFIPVWALSFVDLLIDGAQTKPYKPPKIEWVEEIVQATDKAGIPVFLKDNLKPLLPLNILYSQPALSANGKFCNVLRQEMPELKPPTPLTIPPPLNRKEYK